jgi:hypothetical protein
MKINYYLRLKNIRTAVGKTSSQQQEVDQKQQEPNETTRGSRAMSTLTCVQKIFALLLIKRAHFVNVCVPNCSVWVCNAVAVEAVVDVSVGVSVGGVVIGVGVGDCD